MKVIAVALLLLGSVALSQQSGPSLQDIKDLVATVQADLVETVELFSDVRTLCAAADDNINYIYDFFIARIKVVNEQQNELIVDYTAQVKNLQHRIDDAKAREKAAISLSNSTQYELNRQLYEYLNGSIKSENREQNRIIYDLERNVTKIKNRFLVYLNSSIIDLDESEDENEVKIENIIDFVDSRKCEYGYVYVPIDGYKRVYFKTQFDYAPNVTVVTPGFVAHLDRYKADSYDVLKFNQAVGDVTNTYFDIHAKDESTGQAEVKYLTASWMACQNLDSEVSH